MFERLEDYPQYKELFIDLAAYYPMMRNEAMMLVEESGMDSDAPYQYNQHGQWKANAFKWRDNLKGENKTPVATTFAKKWGNLIQSGLYSYLGPQSFIPEHTEQTKIMRCHLPLIVPSIDALECGIRVESEIRPFTPGEVFLFRDFKPHEVWNRTDKFRINMILDLPDPNQ